MPKRKQSDVSKKEERSSLKEKKRPSEDEWSKSKKKRMRRLKAKQNIKDFPEKTTNLSISEKTTSLDNSPVETPSSEPKGVKTSSALQQSFMARLTGSRFRELNEVRPLRDAKQVSAQLIPASFSQIQITSFSLLHRNCTRRHLLLHSSVSLVIQNCTSNITMDFVTKWNSGRSIQ
jgi:hypothetical protein